MPERNGKPQLKQYLSEMQNAGVPIGTVWDDIAESPSVNPNHYPTQLPLDLVERVVLLGSHPDDLVLDPYSGSGVMLEAAARNGRRWIGGDHDPAAVAFAYERMRMLKASTAAFESAVRLSGVQDLEGIEQTARYYNPDLTHLVNSLFSSTRERTLTRGTMVPMEEGMEHEFKKVTAQNVVKKIIEEAEEYTVAFLNAGGPGRLWFGIQDDGIVLGVTLSRTDRDQLQRDLMHQLSQIQPPISPGAFRLNLYQVVVGAEVVEDQYVVELVIPEVKMQSLFFTPGGSAYLKYAGGRKKLTGLHLQDEILRRFGV